MSDDTRSRSIHRWRHAVLHAAIIVALLGIIGVAVFRASTTAHVPTYIRVVSLVNIAIGLACFPFAIKTIVGALVVMFVNPDVLHHNGRYLSTISTEATVAKDVETGCHLPPVFIHLPVYLEALDATLRPTLLSLRCAVDAYINIGGAATILVMDDGMAFLSVEERERRMEAYTEFGASHVARGMHGRAGLFKKASNMNYALLLHRPSDDGLIMIVDSDTRVPEHCISMTVHEFVADSSVSFVQHATTPFTHQENGSPFERFLCRFTHQIYWSGILLGVALGDGAPLVGHNAFLRWSAVADACPSHSPNTFWSEDTVSEDFDMSLRLVTRGGIGRYATYCGEGFQEGVSKTLVDEIHKWRKYTYGVCELIFSPKRSYAYVMAEGVPWHHKVSLGLYISSYMAMGLSVPFAIIEGVMSLAAPSFFTSKTCALHALDVTIASSVTFALFGTGGEIILRIRSSKRRIGVREVVRYALAEITKIPMFVLFFGCLPIHIASSTLSFVLRSRPTWGSTAKDGETQDMTLRSHAFIVFWPEYLAISILGVVYISLAFVIKGGMDV